MIVKTGKDSLAESRVKNSGKNAIWGLANRLTTILFPFVTRTIIIYTLGSEYIGLDSLFVSIFQVLNFAEIGFGTAMVYNMYKPIAEGDNKTLCALLNFYKNFNSFHIPYQTLIISPDRNAFVGVKPHFISRLDIKSLNEFMQIPQWRVYAIAA